MLTHWIQGGKSPFYARRGFFLKEDIRSAKLTVCGLGQFIASLNGQKVGDHELDPAWTDYRKYIQYVEFDVSGLLHPGENVLGLQVGNGWYLKQDEHYTFAFPPFMPPNPNPYQPFGDALIASAELKVSYADGSEETVDTAEGFKLAPHIVTMSNVYGSETIDNRYFQSGWDAPGFDDSTWQPAKAAPAPAGKLVPQYQPAVKVIATYSARKLCVCGSRTVYDLGQNISGILSVKVIGNAGDTLRIYPAEKRKADGDVDQTAKNWCELDTQITCILSGRPEGEHFRMAFTYFAGRYLAVETEAEVLELSADAISSAWKQDGSFFCSDPRHNKIYDMIEKTVEANLLGVHTDCPTIERFAWQEPNHLMAPSIFYMKDGRLLWDKFLRDLREAQHGPEDYFLDFAGSKFYPGDGLVPSQAPCYIPNVLPVPGMGSFYDIIPWGSTCILGTWWHYEFYGDKQILEDNYDMGLRYLRHLNTKMNAEGFVNHGLGDWGNPRNELARENIETTFLYADTVILAKMSEVLGRCDTGLLFSAAERIKENYNRRLLVQHPTEGFLCYRCYDHPDEVFLTQAAQALPLYWGLVPEEAKDDVVQALRYTLENEEAFISGEVGLPYVIQAARQNGMNDLICKCILREEHPSYYAFILDGETTLGEYWEHNPRSHCHDMMGHIIEWFYNGLAGIQPLSPGFSKVRVEPYLPEGMESIACSYHSVSGSITVKMQSTPQEITLVIQAPDAVSVEVSTVNLAASGKSIIVRKEVISCS